VTACSSEYGNGSMLWNFNYREPVTKKRINMGLGPTPNSHWQRTKESS
jgi:hypothetical protein